MVALRWMMQDDNRSDGQQGPLRRSTPRVSIDYDLKVEMHGDHVPYTGLIKDISTGGLFITTTNRHVVGDVIEIRFTFPTVNDPIEITASVQWVRDEFSEGELPPGIGVQFVGLPDDIAAKINAYIKDKDVPFYDEGF